MQDAIANAKTRVEMYENIMLGSGKTAAALGKITIYNQLKRWDPTLARDCRWELGTTLRVRMTAKKHRPRTKSEISAAAHAVITIASRELRREATALDDLRMSELSPHLEHYKLAVAGRDFDKGDLAQSLLQAAKVSSPDWTVTAHDAREAIEAAIAEGNFDFAQYLYTWDRWCKSLFPPKASNKKKNLLECPTLEPWRRTSY